MHGESLPTHTPPDESTADDQPQVWRVESEVWLNHLCCQVSVGPESSSTSSAWLQAAIHLRPRRSVNPAKMSERKNGWSGGAGNDSEPRPKSRQTPLRKLDIPDVRVVR